MKNRKSNFPRSLASLPQIDFFQPEPGEDPATGGSIVGHFDSVDFRMFSGSAACNGCEIDYTEVHLDGAGVTGTEPIKNQDVPEKAMLLMGLPRPNDDWTMSLKLSGPNSGDEIQMSSYDGKFDVLRTELGGQFTILFEEAGLFFTFEREAGKFETYVNVNQVPELVRLQHGVANIFDDFSVSFLGRSNAPE